MNKIALPILLLIIGYTYSLNIDEEHLEPYEEFNWLDEDDYTITVPFTSSADMVTPCCLYNGTKLCAASECSSDTAAFTVSCKFTGNSCKADSDNPATKFYYSLYCSASSCTSDAASNLANSDNAYVTVAVLAGSYIKYSIVLLLSLLAF